MDRLVTVDLQELQLTFKPNQTCRSTFHLTNLMHTMSVAISLTTTNPSLFSFSLPFFILPLLSSSPFSIQLHQLSNHPPLSFPSDTILLRSSILATGKATTQDLRRLFSIPGRHIFKDAVIPITFVGDHVVEFLQVSDNALKLKNLQVLFLLSKAVSVCTKSKVNELLKNAVVSGKSRIVTGLIDAGGDVNQRNFEGKSLLFYPMRSGDIDLVKILIDSGYRIEDSNELFLHEAAKMNRVDLMEILGRNVDCVNVKLVNSVNSVGRTAVHEAAVNGNLEALKFCVSSMNGDPDFVDNDGWTPLHCAAAEGHIEAVEFLLDCCLYSKYAINKDGKTPFSVAVDNGQDNCRLLNMLHLDDVLHQAARLGDVSTIKSCIAQGAKVNGKDQNGWTPLHRAAFKGRMESVKTLISYGAQVDLVDNLGYTPLHYAIQARKAQVVLYLTTHGARGRLKSLQGVSPVISDRFKNHSSFVSPLIGKMERV